MTRSGSRSLLSALLITVYIVLTWIGGFTKYLPFIAYEANSITNSVAVENRSSGFFAIAF